MEGQESTFDDIWYSAWHITKLVPLAATAEDQTPSGESGSSLQEEKKQNEW